MHSPFGFEIQYFNLRQESLARYLIFISVDVARKPKAQWKRITMMVVMRMFSPMNGNMVALLNLKNVKCSSKISSILFINLIYLIQLLRDIHFASSRR